MRKRSYVYIGLCIASLGMGLTGCSSSATPPTSQNSTTDETENTTQDELNEELDQEEVADEPELTKEDNDVDAIETTQLYDELFKDMIDRVGSISFDMVVKMANATSREIKITEPTDEVTGRVKIYDDNGCVVTFVFYPNNAGIETLTLLTYSNDIMEASVSNDYHDGDLKFSTFVQTRDPEHVEVDSEEELREFVFIDAIEYMDAYNESVSENTEFEVTFDVETVQESDGVSFQIKTNLPDEADLKLTFTGDDYIGQMNAVVEDGIAVSDSFSNRGYAFAKGKYTLRVSMSLPAIQSQNVQDVVGANGEFMTGPYVEDDGNGRWVSGEFDITIK